MVEAIIKLGCDKRSLSPSGERCLRQFDGPGAQLYHMKISFYINFGAKLHSREVKIMTSFKPEVEITAIAKLMKF